MAAIEIQKLKSVSSVASSDFDSDDDNDDNDDNEDKKEEQKETEIELEPLQTEEEEETKKETTANLICHEDVKLSRKYEKFLTFPNDEIVEKDDKIDALILQLKLPHIYALADDEQYAIIQEKYSWIDDEDGEIDQFQYEEIQEVVQHMTSIERRHMFDTIASKSYDERDEEQRDEYHLVPAKLKTLKRYAKIKKGSYEYVCSGCGVLLLQDQDKHKTTVEFDLNTKKKKKFNKKRAKAWRGYICKKTDREFIFHNRLCVKFRKAKEWIRDAVYEQDIDLGYIDPPRMQIDFLKNDDLDAEFQPSQFFTTFDETEKKRVKYRQNIRFYYRECVSTDLRGYDIDEGDRFSAIPIEIKYLDQREFAVPMYKFLIHQVQVKEFNLFWMFLKFAASYINTPKLIALLKESSDVLFPLHDDTHSGDDSNKNELIEFLTIIAEGALYPIATCLYISAYLKENGDQYWNDEETEILSKHFRNMANTIIDEIENEHLVAIILETPTNIYDDDSGDASVGLSVIDIAIKYKMLRFLQNNKISRIATTLWYDRKIIHPDVRFGDELSFYDLSQRLAKEPAIFFFSPSGLNIVKFVLYLLYLALFSWVTMARRYSYEQEGAARSSQNYLLFFNIAFILYEFYRCLTRIKTYFGEISNINEFSKAILWIIILYIRFMYESQVLAIECTYFVRSADPFIVDCGFNVAPANRNRGNSSLSIDCEKYIHREDPVDCTAEARHNYWIVEIYMGLWAIQCILFWMSLLFYLSRTRTVGPMLRMISLMIRDMFNFLFLMVVLWISISLSIYYIIGDDLAANDSEHDHSQINSTLSSCLFYGLLTMLGQQEWSAIEEVAEQHISPFRIVLLDGVVALAAFAGTILLLNLLIAMLSNTYNEVSELSVLEVNYTRISQSYSASRDITLIPPPLNYFAFALMSVWFLCDTLLTAFTARTKMLNDWFFTPLNRKAFSAGDYIYYKDPNDLQPEKIYEGYIKHCFTNEIAQIQVAEENKFIHRDNIIRIRKSILTNTNPSDDNSGVCASFMNSGRYYCKYCRYFYHGNQVGNVEQVQNLFKYYAILLDEDDVGKLGNMLNDKRKRRKRMFAKRRKKKTEKNKQSTIGLSLRQLGVAQLCPSCYRPFYCSRDHCDETSRLQYMAEICSFVVFMVVCYVPLLCLFAIPAIISYVFSVLVGKEQLIGGKKAKRQKQQEKLAKKLKMSQGNDKYRHLVVNCFDDIRPINEYVEDITNRLNKCHKKIRESEIEDVDDNIVTQLHQDMELQKLTLTKREGRERMQELRKLYKEWCVKLDAIMNIIIEKKKKIKAEQEVRRSQLMEMMMIDEDDFDD